MFLAKIRKNITIFHPKIIIFSAIKNRNILHRRVIVMHIQLRIEKAATPLIGCNANFQQKASLAITYVMFIYHIMLADHLRIESVFCHLPSSIVLLHVTVWVCSLVFCFLSCSYTIQNLIRTKLVYLFAGCPANLIPKML